MKRLKFLNSGAVAAGFFLLAGSVVLAQDQSQPQAAPQQAPADAPKARDHEKLNLTDDQKAQLKKIHEDAKLQMETVRNDSSLSQEQKKAKAHEIHQAAREQMSGVLTPEQREIMKERRHKRHHARMKRHRQQQAAPEASPQQQ